jgi:hypothetical protein
MTDRQAGRWCGRIAVVGMLGLLSFCLITSGPALWAEYNAPPRPPQTSEYDPITVVFRAIGFFLAALLKAIADEMSRDFRRFELTAAFLQFFFDQFFQPTRPLWELFTPPVSGGPSKPC